jgi:hypothetical protein
LPPLKLLKPLRLGVIATGQPETSAASLSPTHTMNTSTIAGLIRTLIAAAAGFAAAKGVDITGLDNPEFANALAIVGVGAWSVFSKRKASAPAAK